MELNATMDTSLNSSYWPWITNDSDSNVTHQSSRSLKCPNCPYDQTVIQIRDSVTYVEVAIGVIGNLLSFVVIHCCFPRSTNNLCLKCLAFADTIFLLSAILGLFTESIADNNSRILYHLAVDFFMNDISQFVSCWLMVVLACTRFLAVARPFRIDEYVTHGKVSVAIAILLLLAIAVELTRIFTIYKFEYIPNSTEYTFGIVDAHVYFIAEGVFFGFCLCVLPLLLLLAFSVGLIRELYKHRRSNPLSEVSVLSRESRSITKMVIAVVTVFCVSYFPYLAFAVFYLDPDYRKYIRCNRCAADIMYNIAYMSAHFNSCVNFLIYFVFKKSFRKHLWQLCRKERNGLRRSSSSRTSNRTVLQTFNFREDAENGEGWFRGSERNYENLENKI